MLIIGIFSEIANGFDAKYFDDYVVSRKVFIEKVVILIFAINSVDLALVIESLVEMLHNVLNHHNFELTLLFDELNDILESCTLVF